VRFVCHTHGMFPLAALICPQELFYSRTTTAIQETAAELILVVGAMLRSTGTGSSISCSICPCPQNARYERGLIWRRHDKLLARKRHASLPRAFRFNAKQGSGILFCKFSCNAVTSERCRGSRTQNIFERCSPGIAPDAFDRRGASRRLRHEPPRCRPVSFATICEAPFHNRECGPPQ